MKGRAIAYSAAELAFIKDLSHLPRKALHQAFCDWTGRTDVSFDALKALCARKGWATGRTGCFAKGQTPVNKGKKMPFNENSARTQFKKGVRRGIATKLYKPIGTERVSREGYLECKINDDLPLQARWRAVHLIRWEAQHGQVPAGHRLKCLDGNKQNTDPANWEAIPVGMLPRLNGRFGRGYDSAPPELKPTIMATAKLAHLMTEKRRAARGGGND